MKLLFCGDIMPGGVLPYQDTFIDPVLLNTIKEFDLRIGTLECAIGSGIDPDKTKMQGDKNIIYARHEDFYRVLQMRFNVVSLANNHVFDLGEEGLKNTIRVLDENSISYCGAGMNINQASRPAVINVNGKSVAFIAACMYGNKYLGYIELADENKSGVNPLEIDKICHDISLAKTKYDYVFVLPHWGREHFLYPMNDCIVMSKKMIESGADGVFGSHAHVPQPRIFYKNKPIFFGMGNFLFPDFFMFPPRPIWYPNNGYDVSTIVEKIGYPDEILVPTKATWGKMERIGELVSVEIENKRIKTKLNFVQMGKNNILSNYTTYKKLYKSLWLQGLLIKNPFLKKVYVQTVKMRGGEFEEY